MQRGSTILQHLTFRPNVSLTDPATSDGKLWNSALKIITRSQGWSQLHWGVQLASGNIVDLLITWESQAEIARFMAHNRPPFLTALQPLLLHENHSNPAPDPYVLQLHPGMPTLELGAVSSLYELSFDPTPNSDVKTGLAIETQLCRSFFQDAAQAIGDGESFLGMDAVWVEPYDPDLGDQTSQAKITPPRTLFVIICWASQNSENLVLSSGQMSEPSSGGQTLTTGEYFAKNILHLADHYTKNDVTFENVSAANVAWLDKEEKWSTYVARLLAEENDRRKKEDGGRES